MLIIRLSRIGKKNHAQFRLVLAEKTYPVKGKFTELLGSYDPHLKTISLKEDRIKHWLDKGVSCSDTAYNLLVKNGVIQGEKRKVKLPEKPKPEAAPEEQTKEEAPAPKEATAEPEKTESAAPAQEQAEAPKTETPKEEKAEQPQEEKKVAEKVEAPKEEAPKEEKAVEKTEAPVEAPKEQPETEK